MNNGPCLDTLNQIIQSTEQFRKAEATGRLKKIPISDGMALVLYTSLKAPVNAHWKARQGIS
jgi:hypothetical protein